MPNNTAFSTCIRFILIVTVATYLTACGDEDFTDLQRYIDSIKNRPHEPVKPLPEFQTIEPFVFKAEENLRDPFKPFEKAKTTDDIDESEEPDNGIRPDFGRAKEPLEAFSLSGMKMVGTITMNSVFWALIKSDNNIIYRVKVGNHMGKNDGKITHIDKKKIELVEIMPGKSGRFVEQPTTLTLME